MSKRLGGGGVARNFELLNRDHSRYKFGDCREARDPPKRV